MSCLVVLHHSSSLSLYTLSQCCHNFHKFRRNTSRFPLIFCNPCYFLHFRFLSNKFRLSTQPPSVFSGDSSFLLLSYRPYWLPFLHAGLACIYNIANCFRIFCFIRRTEQIAPCVSSVVSSSVTISDLIFAKLFVSKSNALCYTIIRKEIQNKTRSSLSEVTPKS